MGLVTFTVHEPPNPPADRIERADKLTFVKDGFSWMAALLAPLWMLVHRLWWALLGYILAVAALRLAQKYGGLTESTVGLVMFALNLLIGFEADTLRRWALDRKGWLMLGAVSGRNRDECERRFFDGWLPAQPILRPTGEDKPSPSRRWPVIGSLRGARA
jgi:uncharacterized protein DUF2628